MAAGNLNQIAEWIANLGVYVNGELMTIRDLGNIPETVEPQDCPLLAPYPDAFVSGVELERLTFRPTVGRRYKLTYTITYVLYYGLATEGLTLFQAYEGLTDAWSAVMTKLIEEDTPDGAHDIRPVGNPAFGPVADASGQLFHGCRFDLQVTEFG